MVIAGKGHEQGQELADGLKLPFDDVEVAREVLRARSPDGRRERADEGMGRGARRAGRRRAADRGAVSRER